MSDKLGLPFLKVPLKVLVSFVTLSWCNRTAVNLAPGEDAPTFLETCKDVLKLLLNYEWPDTLIQLIQIMMNKTMTEGAGTNPICCIRLMQKIRRRNYQQSRVQNLIWYIQLMQEQSQEKWIKRWQKVRVQISFVSLNWRNSHGGRNELNDEGK